MNNRRYPSDWNIPNHVIHIFSPKRHHICLVIPVINEGDRFLRQLEEIKPFTSEVDIIIADGGSTDGSTNRPHLKKNQVRALLIKQDSGKLSAQLRIAYAFALTQGYQGIITMDGNGKDGREGIKHMREALEKGYDYVQGSRYIKGGKSVNTPRIRHLANHYLHAPVLSLASHYYWFTDTTNGFRAYSRTYLLDSRVKPFRNIFQTYELLAYLTVRASQLGYKVKEVPVTRAYPSGNIPTKISFLQGNIDLLKILFLTLMRRYNP